MIARPADADRIELALAHVLASRHFALAPRLCGFLRLIVQMTLRGEAAEIKEYVIATQVYERDQSYDPRVDSIVRVEASRLRSRLDAYYAAEGSSDPIRIELPKGAYVPVFVEPHPAAPAPHAPAAPTKPVTRRTWLIAGASSAAAAAAVIVARSWPRFPLPVAMLMTAQRGPRGGGSADADRLTLELANALGRHPGLKVTRSENPPEMRERARSIATPFYVVALTGQCWEAPDRVRVVAELRHTATGDAAWSGTLDDHAPRSAELAERSAHEIGVVIRRFTAARAPSASRVRAHDLYAEAVRLRRDSKDFLLMTAEEAASSWPLEELMRIAHLLERAIAEDPGFAPAHAALGETYRLASEYDSRIYPKSRAAVEAALRLDAGSAEANFVKGYTSFFVDWNFVAAEAALRKCIERSRLYVAAYRYYVDAALLAGCGDRAVPLLASAASVLPRTLSLSYAAIMLSNHHRDYAGSERLVREALTVHTDSVALRCQLATLLGRQGKWSEAEQELAKAVAAQPKLLRTAAARARFFALQGRKREALEVVRESNMEKRGPAIAGMIYSRLGEMDQAFHYLEVAAREHNHDLPYATLEPEFEALRRDPRSAGILQHLRTGA